MPRGALLTGFSQAWRREFAARRQHCSGHRRADASRRSSWTPVRSSRTTTLVRMTRGVPTWEEIVDRHSDRVYRLALRLTGNRHDAEDLTQEVFVRVFRSLSTYTPGTFEGWIHRITTNLFLDQARRKQRIRFDALSDERADRLHSDLPDARHGVRRHHLRRRHRAGALHAPSRVPRRRRALRRGGPVLRGDRRRSSTRSSAPSAPASTAVGRCSARLSLTALPSTAVPASVGRAVCPRGRPRDRPRDRSPRPARQRPPRRSAVRDRRGACLGPRALLPPVPRRGRA